MANLHDSYISCTDRKAMRILKKVVKEHTPSRILKKGKDFIKYETKWDDLEKAVQIISKDFPTTSFECAFHHATECNNYSYTKKTIKDGDSVFVAAKPMYFIRCIKGKDLIESKIYDEFIKRCLEYFDKLYLETHYDDGKVGLQQISQKYNDCNKFKIQAEYEYESLFLSATLSGYAEIDIEIKEQDKENLIAD